MFIWASPFHRSGQIFVLFLVRERAAIIIDIEIAYASVIMSVIELTIVGQNYVYAILDSSRSGLGASTAKVFDYKLYYYQLIANTYVYVLAPKMLKAVQTDRCSPSNMCRCYDVSGAATNFEAKQNILEGICQNLLRFYVLYINYHGNPWEKRNNEPLSLLSGRGLSSSSKSRSY